jgi:hypothetical protein
MADCPQYALQIMETQTRFDLNAAVAKWLQELAAQPDLTPDVCRELETHLRDTVADLRRRGLSDEESFWLASRRLGRPERLNEEFAKADPANVWRERIFWVMAALLAMNLWSTFCTPMWMPVRFIHTRFNDVLPGWILFYLPGGLRESRVLPTLEVFSLGLRIIPILTVAAFLAKGRLKFSYGVLRFLTASRKRFFLVSLGAGLLANSVDLLGAKAGSQYFLPIWSFTLIIFATWLIQPKKEPSAKAA